MRVSPSKLAAASKCLRALQYSLTLPKPPITSISRSIGTGVHAALELAYQAAPEWTSLDVLVRRGVENLQLELEQFETVTWSTTIPDLDTAFEVTKVMIRDYFSVPIMSPEDGSPPIHRYWPVFEGFGFTPPYRVLGVERRFETPAPDLVHPYTGETSVATGFIDLVLEHAETGGIYGVDHKTTGSNKRADKWHPRKNPQPPMYTTALRETYPGRPWYGFAFDVTKFLAPIQKRPEWSTTFERITVNVTPEHEAATRLQAQQVVALVDAYLPFGRDLPANPGHDLCSADYCDYFEVCPFGAALS